MMKSDRIQKLARLISDYSASRWKRTMKAVRSGRYSVDPLKLSRRIISDLLGPT